MTEQKSKYRKPTSLELLGHVFVGHPEDNYTQLAFTVIGGIFVVCGAGNLGPAIVKEAVAGHWRDFFANLLVASPGLGVWLAQLWFLGTEGWSPEYRLKKLAYQKALEGEHIPPQI